MHNALILTGTLTDAHLIALDEPLPWLTAKVRVMVEPLSPIPTRSYSEVMASIRERQQARGHVPPSRAEVDATLQAERDSWES